MDTTEGIERPRMTVTVLKGRLAVAQLPPDASVPDWACRGDFCSLTRTPDELSVLCPEQDVPDDVPHEAGWVALRSNGPLGFTLTGVVEALTEPLAVAGITIFVISTYNTDYVLVKQPDVDIAIVALNKAGHTVRKGDKVYPPRKSM